MKVKIQYRDKILKLEISAPPLYKNSVGATESFLHKILQL
jgi:hypothetical protein